MKRDIYRQLLDWKASKRRKPLIVNGARQVGKTHALKHFGKHNFENTVYLNFERNEKLCTYFEGNLDPIKLINTLSIYAEIDIDPSKTLIIFDEIQACPRALNSLKYFCEEAPEYHITAAGSLLGVKTAQQGGFPVGKVNFLHLYPLSFFEFLSALGHNKLRVHLEELAHTEPLAEIIHHQLIDILKLYFFIGGMPEAVSEYVKSENLRTVREIQLEILDAYEKDFAKHAPPNEVMKITTVFKQVHQQLAKENKKFIFSTIKKSARGREYETAIQWLIDAGLISKSSLVESPKLPLSAYAKHDIFKIFLLDIGLLGAQSNLSPKTVIEKDLLFTEFKGALTENFVAQEFKLQDRQSLYYWASNGTAELDFLLESDHAIYPLEVKAGSSKRKKSLLVYNSKYSPKITCRTSLMNLKKDGNLLNLPLYLIAKITTFIVEASE
ncbi:MAG: AAA family ATPase [Simkaniaceae bacterium]|nr:AAA family ATPase [Simkaniaceae bacterium]